MITQMIIEKMMNQVRNITERMMNILIIIVTIERKEIREIPKTIEIQGPVTTVYLMELYG